MLYIHADIDLPIIIGLFLIDIVAAFFHHFKQNKFIIYSNQLIFHNDGTPAYINLSSKLSGITRWKTFFKIIIIGVALFKVLAFWNT